MCNVAETIVLLNDYSHFFFSPAHSCFTNVAVDLQNSAQAILRNTVSYVCAHSKS